MVSSGIRFGKFTVINMIGHVHTLVWNTNNVYAVSDEGVENKMLSFRKAIIPHFNIITFFAEQRFSASLKFIAMNKKRKINVN